MIARQSGITLSGGPNNPPGMSSPEMVFLHVILEGKAKDLDEAEELYPDQSLPEVLERLRQPIPDEELARHPLMTLVRVPGSRGCEDSVL
jgi:hypothetical protein